jgi:cytochrome c biogenesis protein ResB
VLGYTFEFVRERQFSGLQVVHNPAMNLIWFAAGCMLLGVLAVFNFPLRRVWARAEPGPEGVRLRLASVSNRDVLFAREFEGLALSVDKEVTALVRETGGRAKAPPSGAPGTVEEAVHALH